MKVRRIILCVFISLLFAATTAYAGVMEVVKALSTSGGLWAGLGAVVLLFVFKAIPNDKLYGNVKGFTRGLGITVTLGLSKWAYTAPLWNKTIEPWLVDFIENTVGAAVAGLIEGLRSDNA